MDWSVDAMQFPRESEGRGGGGRVGGNLRVRHTRNNSLEGSQGIESKSGHERRRGKEGVRLERIVKKRISKAVEEAVIKAAN